MPRLERERGGEPATDERRTDEAGIASTAVPSRPVVLGLDVGTPDEALLGFAFDAAARHRTPPRAAARRARLEPAALLRLWHGPGTRRRVGDGQGAASLPAEVPRRRGRRTVPLRQSVHPPLHEERAAQELQAALADAPADAEVRRRTVEGHAGQVLLDASADAGLLVVGPGAAKATTALQLGRVTHAVLHHLACPAAVVPQRA